MVKQLFMNGLKAFVPIALTLAIVVFIFRSIETFFEAVLTTVMPAHYYFDGLGILVGIFFIFILGILVNAWLIKNIYQLVDHLVKKIPFVKTIYTSIQDLVGFFEKTQTQTTNQVVVCEMGGMKVLGFVTKEHFDGLPEAFGDEDSVLVYVPMSYMVGGMMVSVPKSKITPVDMTTNQAMSVIITAGLTGADESRFTPIE